MDVIQTILYSEPHSLRFNYRDQIYLDTDEQVDILIEQATDPNLLSRIWIGWSPFI